MKDIYGEEIIVKKDIYGINGSVYITKGKVIILDEINIERFKKLGILEEILENIESNEQEKHYQQFVNEVEKVKQKYNISEEVDFSNATECIHKIIFEEKFFKKYPHLITLAEHAEWYYTHNINVAILSVLLAKQLGYDDNTIREIVIGAILHDIGLIFIDKEILYKEDIELEVEDMELRKKHCNLGIMTMKSASIPLVSEKIIEQHHEELDGTGYPKQLKKESILKEAHIVAIADRLDTRISYKGEKKVEALQDVITDMHKMSKKYDRKSVNALKKIFNI